MLPVKEGIALSFRWGAAGEERRHAEFSMGLRVPTEFSHGNL